MTNPWVWSYPSYNLLHPPGQQSPQITEADGEQQECDGDWCAEQCLLQATSTVDFTVQLGDQLDILDILLWIYKILWIIYNILYYQYILIWDISSEIGFIREWVELCLFYENDSELGSYVFAGSRSGMGRGREHILYFRIMWEGLAVWGIVCKVLMCVEVVFWVINDVFIALR